MRKYLKPALNQNFNAYSLIGLCVLLAFVINVLFGLHENAHKRYEKYKALEWLQPVKLNVERFTPIGNKVWTQELINIERVLWRVKRNHSNDVLVNSETLAVLTQASSLLAADVSSQELERLLIILKKSMPNDKILVELLSAYRSYDKEYRANVVAVNSATGNKKRQLLNANRQKNQQLQERFFGEDNTRKLFAEHNVMLNYLNDRRITNMSEELTEAQKKEQLLRLKNSYKTSKKIKH